ncbi:macrophage mannose receptor 1-like [Patiria miniata]|uniref:C-type lectin n=1 Tax=Patiria miniata TaxID=46514 RepID=A0A914B1C0_PATMI|nr:macrophage mannose receptor 1-like [Patiria miniata]
MMAISSWWILLTCVISRSASALIGCPDDKWESLNGRCYVVGYALNSAWYQVPWEQAREICKGLGGDLIVTNTAEEYEFAFTLMQNTGDHKFSWTRCSTTSAGELWTCADDPSSYSRSDPGSSVGYWDWRTGSPSDPPYYASRCMNLYRLVPPYGMYENPCTNSKGFICEMEAVEVPTTLQSLARTTAKAKTVSAKEGLSKRARVSRHRVVLRQGGIGRLTNYCLKSESLLRALPAKQVNQCAALCLQDSRCRSFNYFGERQTCHLFFVDASDVDSDGFGEDEDCAHYEIQRSNLDVGNCV